jgi:hypothetical protein
MRLIPLEGNDQALDLLLRQLVGITHRPPRVRPALQEEPQILLAPGIVDD